MKQNIIKKSILYSMLFGLLVCNGLMSMNQNNQDENKRSNFGLTDQNTDTNDDGDRFDSRNDEGVLLSENISSGAFSFTQGFLTPQNNNIYYVLNIISALQSLKMAFDAGKSRNILINDRGSLSSIASSYMKPLAYSACLYGAGFLFRKGIAQGINANKFATLGYSVLLFFSSAYLLKNNVFSHDHLYIFKFNRSRSVIDNEELFEKIVDILKRDEKNSEKMLENLIDNNLSINKFFGIALKKDNRDIIKLVMNYYKKELALWLDSPYIFIEAINWNEKEVFDELLAIAEDGDYEDLIDIFMNVVYGVIQGIQKAKNNNSLSENDENKIYDFLEKFFKVIERMGYNPYNLNSNSSYTPIIKSLVSYNAIVNVFHNTVQVYPNPFLEKVIHYFVEMGVPLYEHKNDHIIKLNGYLQINTFNSRTPFDIAVAMSNQEMQDYFKLIGRYNKQLFNANEDVNNLEDLKFFITELEPQEKDAIFRVAAMRGHMKPLTILDKIDDKKYSMDEAKKLAQKRNLTKVVTMFEKRKTISNEVICALQDIGIKNNNECKIIAIGIKDMLNRANLKRFDALVNEFRKKD